jgi:DNA helicase-2/ATP-dependent DNA helicase PcrA
MSGWQLTEIWGVSMGNDLLDQLNEGQRIAALSEAPHTLVLAGAGTGKTTTIVARCAHLIMQGVPPSKIQVLTFTRRSAQDIRGRVESRLGSRAEGLGASTFHAWCMSLMRSNPEVFGYEDWTVIDADDQGQLFKMIRGALAMRTFPTSGDLRATYSYARNTKKGLKASIEEKLEDFVHLTDEIVDVFREYEARKKVRRYLDYDDILAIVSLRLEANEATAAWLGSTTPHVLVDEMQDTNPLQWSLLAPLLPYSSIFCVGDDAQAIYSFRGADFENIRSFTDRVPNGVVLQLTENYRSTQEILDLSNWLLAVSGIDYNKQLVAARGSGARPEVHSMESEFDEANWIAGEIEKDVEEGYEYADSLVLTRSAWGARAVEAAFLSRKIPFRILGGTALLESAHIKDVLSLLRCVANPRDELAWMRYLTLFPKIGDVGARKIMDQQLAVAEVDAAVTGWQPRYSNLMMPQVVPPLEAVSAVATDVEAAIEVAIRSLTVVLSNNYKNQNWDTRKLDFVYLQQLAKGQSSILGFIENYLLDPMHVSQLKKNVDKGGVTLSTIHSAKGLESKSAFVIGVHPGGYPSGYAVTAADVEEERRVLYVAMTRAADRLVITRINRSHLAIRAHEVSEEHMESYFLGDLPPELADETNHFAPSLPRPELPGGVATNLDLSVPL